MRPTIPLAGWRIAVDLGAVRSLASHIPDPPCGRRCPMCRNWTAAAGEALPTGLQAQLVRLGIDPAAPSDLYGSGCAPGVYRYRLTYHTAGRILTGPSSVLRIPRLGIHRHYHTIRETPWIGLSVAYEHLVHGKVDWRLGTSPVVQVDFRLDVPWRLSETGPADFTAPDARSWRDAPWARAHRRTARRG